jgi:hypothetical protein
MKDICLEIIKVGKFIVCRFKKEQDSFEVYKIQSEKIIFVEVHKFGFKIQSFIQIDNYLTGFNCEDGIIRIWDWNSKSFIKDIYF